MDLHISSCIGDLIQVTATIDTQSRQLLQKRLMYICCFEIQVTLKDGRQQESMWHPVQIDDYAAVHFLVFLRLAFVARLRVGCPPTQNWSIHIQVQWCTHHLFCVQVLFLHILLHQFKVMITLCCKWICTMHLFDCWYAWVDMAMTSVMKVKFSHVIFNILHAIVYMCLFECAWLTHEPNPGMFGILAWGYYTSALLHTSLKFITEVLYAGDIWFVFTFSNIYWLDLRNQTFVALENLRCSIHKNWIDNRASLDLVMVIGSARLSIPYKNTLVLPIVFAIECEVVSNLKM